MIVEKKPISFAVNLSFFEIPIRQEKIPPSPHARTSTIKPKKIIKKSIKKKSPPSSIVKTPKKIIKKSVKKYIKKAITKNPPRRAYEKTTPKKQTILAKKTTKTPQNNKKKMVTTTPPKAPAYLNNPSPFYPRRAKYKGYQGTVILNVNVLKTGRVSWAKIYKSSGYNILDKAAVKSVQKWRFIPAQKNNIPIEKSVHIPIKFALK